MQCCCTQLRNPPRSVTLIRGNNRGWGKSRRPWGTIVVVIMGGVRVLCRHVFYGVFAELFLFVIFWRSSRGDSSSTDFLCLYFRLRLVTLTAPASFCNLINRWKFELYLHRISQANIKIPTKLISLVFSYPNKCNPLFPSRFIPIRLSCAIGVRLTWHNQHNTLVVDGSGRWKCTILVLTQLRCGFRAHRVRPPTSLTGLLAPITPPMFFPMFNRVAALLGGPIRKLTRKSVFSLFSTGTWRMPVPVIFDHMCTNERLRTREKLIRAGWDPQTCAIHLR